MSLEQFDLVLKGGHVIDPANDIDQVADVGIRDGKIAGVNAFLERDTAKHVVDVSEFIVTPESTAGSTSKDPVQARLEIVQKLHSTCASRVYGFLRKSVSPDIADDLTQETFLKLLQVRNLERKSISISYLFRIAQNLLRRRFNVTKRRREVMEKIA